MHLVNHILRSSEVFVEEFHGIPCVVGAPVLPVLYDTIERYLQFTILAYHSKRLILRLIPFPTLMITVGPERQHRRFSRQMPHLSYHSVSVFAVHEVVVHFLSHLTFEYYLAFLSLLGRSEMCGRIVFPVDAISFYGLEEMCEVFEIALCHVPVLSALAHLSVL